jgi:phosphoglycerol transferase MdoB-like AlkP superfamily enzyme
MYFGQTQEQDIKKYNKDNDTSYYWTTNEFYSFIKDSNFIEYNIENFIPDTGRFYTQYATISTHGTYELRGANKEFYNILTSKANKEHFRNMISETEAMGYKPKKMLSQFTYYKAAMMDLDKTIGIIMDRLESTNHLYDTTMVLYSDHNAYYDSMSWKLKGVSVDSHDISVYNLPCIIYDSKVADKYRDVEDIADTTSSIQNNNFMSVIDIYPTLCNILGLEYNTTLAYGNSIFDDTDRLFITFTDTGYIFSQDFFYDGGSIYHQGDNHDTTQFQSLVNDMLHKYHMQENLYKHGSDFANIMDKLYSE